MNKTDPVLLHVKSNACRKSCREHLANSDFLMIQSVQSAFRARRRRNEAAPMVRPPTASPIKKPTPAPRNMAACGLDAVDMADAAFARNAPEPAPTTPAARSCNQIDFHPKRRAIYTAAIGPRRGDTRRINSMRREDKILYEGCNHVFKIMPCKLAACFWGIYMIGNF